MNSPDAKEKADFTLSVQPVDKEDSVHNSEDREVFASGADGVDFRTLGWVKAAIFFTKMTFAAGVLSIPASLYTLGAIAGTFFIVFWSIVNTWMATIQGNFKIKYRQVHTVADAAHIAAMYFSSGNKKVAAVFKEATEILYIISWIICAGVSGLGLSIALNAVSKHATCSIVFGFVSYITIATVASIRKIEKLGWISWVGFISMATAIFTVTIAVGLQDRPAAAPKEGDFDLGFSALPAPGATFAMAWAAALAIFASSANTSGYVPVISEMKKPHDYFKALYCCMAWIMCSYIAIGLTVYRFAGKWTTSPSLGSAGPTIKIVAYAIAIPGLIAGAMICVHVAAKSLFVRFLRNTRHLTENTKTHWAVWLSCTYGTGLAGWILSESIPFFGSLVSLIGAIGFGPLGVVLPSLLWFVLNPNARSGSLKMKAGWVVHIMTFVLGLFITIGGTYANVQNIINLYKAGQVGSAFQCADNSGTV